MPKKKVVMESAEEAAQRRIVAANRLNGAEANLNLASERARKATEAYEMFKRSEDTHMTVIDEHRRACKNAANAADRMKATEMLNAVIADRDASVANATRIRGEYGTANAEWKKAKAVFDEARSRFEALIDGNYSGPDDSEADAEPVEPADGAAA